MKYIQLEEPNLKTSSVLEAEPPRPGAGEVCIAVKAAALNYLDIAVADGSFEAASFPLTPVCDGIGQIYSVGEGVSDYEIGERVIPHFMPNWQGGRISADRIGVLRGVNAPGMLTEHTLASVRSLIRVPAHLSDEEASTLSITATTAWNGIKAGGVMPGSVVVLQGTGGVSLLALQFAKAAGAFVIVTSSSDEKLERVKTLGADALVNYRITPDWHEEVLKITDGYGADLIIDAGGAETLGKSVRAAAFDGVVFVIGFLTGSDARVDISEIFVKRVRIVGNNTGSISDFAEAIKAINVNQVRPVINSVSEFDDYKVAYQNHQESRSFGKSVIRVN